MKILRVVFIVAEIGVNWDGSYHLAKQMMEVAKDSGCNAVKFQAYQEEMITNHPEKLRLMKSAIVKDNVEPINELAKSVGIEWFCTPMYPEAVELLEPFVKRFKVREFDGRPLLQNKTSELLDRILETNKEVIVSSQTSPKSTKYYQNPKLQWLYCVPKYPCELSEIDFGNFTDFDGFSNHCVNIIAPLVSAILGGKIVEIHITSDKEKNFVDNKVSFDYNELRTLVNLIRASEQMKMR